jgi:hypothetical protein
MMKNLLRRLERLERLERTGPSAWQTKLRLCARKLQLDEEELLGIAKGHARQLDRALAEDGRITWEGFQLLCALLEQARPSATEPVPSEVLLGADPQ